MNLERTLTVLNEMQQSQVIGQYAIGGAVAAFLYTEPGTTFDLDVFIVWEPTVGGLIDLGPLYAYLMQRGYQPRREGVMIEGWEVQFITVGAGVTEEALELAITVQIGTAATRVFRVEHLMAICLETGRAKDLARLVQLLEQGNPNQELLAGILDRHGLTAKWTEFQKRLLEPL